MKRPDHPKLFGHYIKICPAFTLCEIYMLQHPSHGYECI